MKKIVSFLLCTVLTLSLSVTAFAAGVKKTTITSAKANSSTAVTIKWKKVKKVSGYIIYRKTQNTSFSKIATVASNKTSYKNTKLSPSTKYTYAIKTYKKSGKKTTYSAYSNQKSVTTKKGYALNKSTVKITEYGGTATVSIKGLDPKKYYSGLKWTISDSNIATCYTSSQSVATVKGYQSGTCTLTANYNGKIYSCKVVVALTASRCSVKMPSVPLTASYYSVYRNETTVYSKMNITKLSYELKDNYDGLVTLKLSFEGTKTYDYQGNSGTQTCKARVKLLDSSGMIIENNYIYASNYRVGDKFSQKSNCYFRNLPADNYTIVVEDYIV